VHNTDSTLLTLISLIRTRRITAGCITTQTHTNTHIKNFKFHYFIIINSYPILFYVIIQKENINRNYISNVMEWWWHI